MMRLLEPQNKELLTITKPKFPKVFMKQTLSTLKLWLRLRRLQEFNQMIGNGVQEQMELMLIVRLDGKKKVKN